MTLNLSKEKEILDALLNFEVPIIPSKTRFWMIRTQNGFFYEEFLAKRFVALAWNNIDKLTDFSEQSKEHLYDDITLKYPTIKRPSTVINKCKHFIHEIAVDDILVIPSQGSRFITFAKAGQYYEDDTKTVELENVIINRIKDHEAYINEVSCPYKKRRHIKLLRTIKSEDLNYSLYRAISNYHGISNFDAYSFQILNELYNCYSFQNNVTIVYNIRKTSPIKPSELSELIYGNTKYLLQLIPEEHISTQVSLNSPGDLVYLLENMYEFAITNWKFFLGLLIFLGGGSALSFQVPGLIDIIKSIWNAPNDLKAKKLETESQELDIALKKIELLNKIKEAGIDPTSLDLPLTLISQSASALSAEPIILRDDDSSIPQTGVEDTEFPDTDEDI